MDFNNQTERRSLLLGLLASSFGGAAFAQSNARILEDLARAALGRAVGTPASTTTPSNAAPGASMGGAGLSLGDADGGLRQALGSAALASALRLGRLDGYWADGKVQIPLPSPLSSIKSLTISDAIQIVRGGDTAGTDMLKSRAGAQLTTLMTPPMAQAVDSSGAGAALDRINARYGGEVQRLGGFSGLADYGALPATNAVPTTASAAAGPLIFGGGSTTPAPAPAAPTTTTRATTPTTAAQPNSLKSQLIGFAVGKALDGLFYYVAEEERAIRRDPAKRTTDLLKRVFGGL
jgi:Protein of unknown function (DUF4197)